MKIGFLDLAKASKFVSHWGRDGRRTKQTQRRALHWVNTGDLTGMVTLRERKAFIKDDYSIEDLRKITKEYLAMKTRIVDAMIMKRRQL